MPSPPPLLLDMEAHTEHPSETPQHIVKTKKKGGGKRRRTRRTRARRRRTRDKITRGTLSY